LAVAAAEPASATAAVATGSSLPGSQPDSRRGSKDGHTATIIASLHGAMARRMSF